MHIATAVEQNYMYTSGATEMGRGERSNPFPTMKTPGPGAYNIYKEVKEKGKAVHRTSEEEEEVNVPSYMIKDKIHPIARGPKLKEAPKTLKDKWTH